MYTLIYKSIIDKEYLNTIPKASRNKSSSERPSWCHLHEPADLRYTLYMYISWTQTENVSFANVSFTGSSSLATAVREFAQSYYLHDNLVCTFIVSILRNISYMYYLDW